MEFIGRQVNFGVAVEAVRGTAEAAASRWLRKVTANVVPRAERVVDDTTFGRLEESDGVRTVREWNEGSVEGILHADAAGFFFLNLYGAVDSQLVDTGVYEHEFTLEQSIKHPTLTLFVKDGDVRDVKMARGVVSAFEIAVATDDYVRFTAEFMGEKEETATTNPATVSEFDFVPRDVTLKFATDEAGLAAATPIKAKDLNISWNPNAIADYVIGNESPDDIYNGAFALDFNFNRNYSDQTFEDLYKGADFRYCLIEIRGEAQLVDGSSNPLIQILLNKVQLTDWTRSGGGNELVIEEISCKAFYNQDDQQQSKITLVNETAGYPAGS